MGLAWTSHGGSTLFIETIKQKRRARSKSDEGDETGNGKIEFTGNYVCLAPPLRMAYIFSKLLRR
jgi:ATP-dependent Lon protease